ncbi:MAG: hypothetical protein TH68_04315 [Candidatus Synechococcus spongiarum 142]|uniref:Uncharacterized protein n=1 Tax=Candidatus Synechococcus spongiarum 142 TaxID=1608213 RepID=A0A6N3X8R1_9SYNE|nr:MAG: hypothetical protein TH68_04315 [Candidatus Synechococcus spongiarum 142]
MFMRQPLITELDHQFILCLLKDLENYPNNSGGQINANACRIWPEPSQKVLDYLKFMIQKKLIEGVQITGPEGQDTIWIDEITWQGKELLSQSED